MSPPIRAGRAKLENVFQIRTPRGVLYGQISHESSGKSRLTRRKVYRYLGTYTPEFRNGRSDKKTRDDARKEELKKTTEEQRRKSILNLKSASNLNGNLNCSKELEHYAS